MKGLTYDEKLQCFIISFHYDYDSKIGQLHLSGCCHAPAAIKMFEDFDPECKRIETFCDGLLDTCYYKKYGEGWKVQMVKR